MFYDIILWNLEQLCWHKSHIFLKGDEGVFFADEYMSEETKEVEEKVEKTEVVENKKEVKKNKKKPAEKKSFAREALEWIICILVAFVLAIIIKYLIFTPTLVKMSSMYPTIQSEERVFVNRTVRTFNLDLNRGDIVTFEAPNYNETVVRNINNGSVKAEYTERKGFEWITYNLLEIGKTSYIKRVIGLPGDHILIEKGKVYVNDEELDESAYLPDGTSTEFRVESLHDFIVPEGYYFCMGDNRAGSQDCRSFGCIPKEKIEGRVLIRIWPLTRFGEIKKSTITREQVDKYNEERVPVSL